MPQSRKRPGHHYKKPADIPSSQRTTGHLLLSLLFAAFGLLMAWFATGNNIVVLILGAVAGGILGWMLGRKMERDSKP